MRHFPSIAAALLLASPALAQETTGEAMAEGGNALVGLIITLIIGAVIGWIASIIMKGGSSGLGMNIILGIGGALLAGFIFPLLGISFGAGLIPTIIAGVIGAIILILIVRLLRGAT
ncbi:GlsB/YeaQ/YmgE family stress response membrane protein [Salipiger sp. CCB-MM3]|uniref:GlsB/YeaQ/YmgE family stress response membrane protein n=1 Tax=Salipiger sp. CCB-MM3 TaxID=1792508 RepID=UPI001F48B1B2|nr:GlsB/YeaQ/YmgE family stress response membrane protein [Salipiger sp. CCB-MM3]